MKHTPGPWIVETDKQGLLVVAQDGGMCVSVTVPGRRSDATDCANAALIAAAPDLLLALHEIVRETASNAKQPHKELDVWDHKRVYVQLRNIASAAIKKAKHKNVRETARDDSAPDHQSPN